MNKVRKNWKATIFTFADVTRVAITFGSASYIAQAETPFQILAKINPL
jgi:hypothetical protein